MEEKHMQLYLVISTAWTVFLVIGDWLLFRKAGRPGIFSIIPFVNSITEYSICWSGWIGFLYFLLMSSANVLGIMTLTDHNFAVPTAILSTLAAVISGVESVKLSESFGKGIGYGIFLFIFSGLGRAILGLGTAEYRGKP